MKNFLNKEFKWHYQKTLVLAYPVMLSQLGHITVGVADSIMVGQLGAVPLAASSLANSIFAIILTFGIGISYGITPLVAAADGEKDPLKIRYYFKHGLILNIVTGIILLIFISSLSFSLYHFGQDKEVAAQAIPYLEIITFSLVPFMFFQTFRQFAEGLSRTKQAMYITVAANLINILLNYLLIFGKFGFPAMGLLGAGYATLISRILMAVLMGLYIAYSKDFLSYDLKFKWFFEKLYFKKILKIGLPSAIQFMFEVGAFVLAAIMVGWLGAEALAAHQIAINLATISYMTATGISAAATIRVGNQLGRKDIPTLRAVGFTSFVLAAIFMAFCASIFLAGHNYFPTLYINDPDVIQLASSLIIVVSLFQLSDGIQVVGLGALRGIADVKIPTYITFLAYWIIGLPVGYYLGFVLDFGAIGIWYGLLLGLTIAAGSLFSRFNYITKKLLKEYI